MGLVAYPEHVRNAAVSRYLDGATTRQVAAEFGVSRWTANDWVRRAGCNRSLSESHRRLNCRHDAFDDPNDIDANYFAGLIAADGCVVGHVVSLGLNKADVLLVESLKAWLESEHSISPDGEMRRLSIASQEMASALKRWWSVVPAKAHVLMPPKIVDERLIASFVRGLFDGDGGLYILGSSDRPYCKWQVTSGSKPMIEWVREVVPVECSKSKHSKKNAWTAYVSNFDDVMTICEWMYGESSPLTRLERKLAVYHGLLACEFANDC